LKIRFKSVLCPYFLQTDGEKPYRLVSKRDVLWHVFERQYLFLLSQGIGGDDKRPRGLLA